MRTKDLIQLPVGDFKMTDGIYEYKMSKSLCDDLSPIYMIRLERDSYNHGERLTLFEDEDYYFEEIIDRYEYGDHKVKYLRGLSGCGGLNIHSDNCYNAIGRLELLARGSFKRYVLNEIPTANLLCQVQ